MGIPRSTPGLEPNRAIALGSATISPINMANAYATIADGGLHHDWFVIKKVTRASDNKVLYKAAQKTDRVLPDDISRDVSYALQQVVKAGTGQNAQALGRPAAGKTGTATNANGDVSSSWFVGYTPQVATAVMYVRGKGNEALNGFLPTYFGANYPTYTWRAIMSAVLEGQPSETFPPAANVDGAGARQRPRAVRPAAARSRRRPRRRRPPCADADADPEPGPARARLPPPPSPAAATTPAPGCLPADPTCTG